MLESVPVPSVEHIKYHPLKAYNNHMEVYPAQTYPSNLAHISQLPFKFQLDDIHSNFVEVRHFPQSLQTTHFPNLPTRLSAAEQPAAKCNCHKVVWASHVRHIIQYIYPLS